MKTQEYLESLKKEYEKTDATLHLKLSGWEQLSRQIDPVAGKKHFWLRNLSIVFAVFAVFLIGTYKIALAALPGDILYPVKLLSEKIIEKTSGSNQIVIDHRAAEIIGLSNKTEVDNKSLEQVVTEYSQSVNQAEETIKTSGKPSINFQNRLDEQHTEFDRVGSEHPDIQNEIKGAQNASDTKSHNTED
jgi:hypothetical protein